MVFPNFFLKGRQIKKFKLLYIIFFFFSGKGGHPGLNVAPPLAQEIKLAKDA